MREERRATLANKTGTPVSWMVSHCETESRREDYVRELREHIQVDVYGGCGNLSCPRSDQWISNPECYELLGQKYKFYLSFENTLCKDYGNFLLTTSLRAEYFAFSAGNLMNKE